MQIKKLSIIKKYILFFLCLVVMATIFIYIFNINRFSGLTADDFLYHFVYTGEWPAKGGPQVYRNLWDWLVAIYNHMTLWNARLTSTFFTILAMQFPKYIFNVVNTLFFLILGLEMNILATGKRVFRYPLQLLLTYLLMWFFLSGFGSTVLWVSGAANYLWATTVILAFFIPYRFNYHVKKHFTLMAWAIVGLGILAGMSNEVGSATSILVVGFFTYFNRPKGVLNDFWWKIVGVLATIFAFLTMIVLSLGSSESEIYGEKDGLIYHISQILSNTMTNSGILFLVSIVLGSVVLFSQPNFFRSIFSKRDLTEDEGSTLSGIIFFVSALAGVGAMAISPALFPRLWFAVNVLLMISILNFLTSYQMLRKDAFFTYTVLALVTLFLMFLAIPSYHYHLNNLKPFYNVFYTHEKLAKEARKTGKQVVRMPGIQIADDLYNPYMGTPYIMTGNPKKLWSNTWMAAYWGVQEVQLDNNVAIQTSPQQNIRVIDSIQNWYDDKFGKTQLFKKIKLPGITYQPKYVLSVKNDSNKGPAINQKLNNRNLSTKRPWLRNALIRYVDVTTNRVVGTERISSPNFNHYDISHAAISGYQTLANNPKSYYFTDSYNQRITIKVKPPLMRINVYYNLIKHDKKISKPTRLATVVITARSGQIATLKAPNRYSFTNGKQTMRLKVNDASSEREIQLVKLPLRKRLNAYSEYYWLIGATLLWIVMDLIFSVIQRKWNERKDKEL